MGDESHKIPDNRLPPITNRPVSCKEHLPSITEAIAAQAKWELNTRPDANASSPRFTPINQTGHMLHNTRAPVETSGTNTTHDASTSDASTTHTTHTTNEASSTHEASHTNDTTMATNTNTAKTAGNSTKRKGTTKSRKTSATARGRKGTASGTPRRRKDAARAGEKWTEAEKKELFKLRRQGLTHQKIGDRLGRTAQSCRLTLLKELRARRAYAQRDREFVAAPAADVEMGEETEAEADEEDMGEETEVDSDVEMEEAEVEPERMSKQADATMEPQSQPETEQEDAGLIAQATAPPQTAAPAHNARDIEGAEALLSLIGFTSIVPKKDSVDPED